jgi:predicted nucleic acid-binding protein
VILADTSIWIDHFRSENAEMRRLLNATQIAIHPLIVAELALGSLSDRPKTLLVLDLLPQVRIAKLSEVRQMIEVRALYSHGIGLIDAQLIAACFINPSTWLWTRDKRLRMIAQSLSIHASLP